jgi:CRP/FNR family nitrogen fixation transcriptional regulator
MQSLTATRAVLTNPAGHMAIRMLQRPASGSVNQIDLIGTELAFAKNGQFYCEGEPSTYLYKIVTGVARSYRMTAEGRRHIVAFYVPGDLFGFETGNTHTLCAEAVTDARVRVMKRASVLNRAAEDFDVAEQLWLSASGEIRRNQEHILHFGRSARARVASFLLEMVRRTPGGDAVALSISRQDIADYLDLRIETVSRAATRLARLGAIAISGSRKITVRNPAVLTQLLK